MKIVEKMAAQGDVLFRRVDSVPDGTKEIERRGDIIVTHSETGHHHVVRDSGVTIHGYDPMISYLRVENYADIVHCRPWDTHETIRLTRGTWEVRRQREHTPEGWRRVED
jgi:hypothetical protein